MTLQEARDDALSAEQEGPASGETQQAPRLVAFSDSLPMTLLRAREVVMARIRPMLREHGLTEQQWRVLRVLEGCEEMEVTPLAHQTCLLPPSLSRILAGLVAAKLIERRPSQEDLRRTLISITREGRILFAAVAPKAAQLADERELQFGAERMTRLHALLKELERALADPAAEQGKA